MSNNSLAQATMWNQRFASEAYAFGTEPNDYLRQHTGLIGAGSTVLCVADGEGRNSVWLARQGAQVSAFDISEVGVAKAQQLAAAANVAVNYTVAGVDDFAWPHGACDAVVAIFVQFADPDMRARLFRNMVSALKPGGVLILLGYTPEQLAYKTGGPSLVEHLYTPALITEAFSTLQEIELVTFEAELQEGSSHAGRSALLGYVGRRA